MKETTVGQVEESPDSDAKESAVEQGARCCNLRKWVIRGGIVFVLFLGVATGVYYYMTRVKPVDIDDPTDYDKLLARLNEELENSDPHPLDPALRRAADGLAHIRKNVNDYTVTMVKQERVNGKLGEKQRMFCKIRNRKMKDGEITVPLSAYLKFLEPGSVAGREVIWVEGQNDDRLIAHEAGWKNALLGTQQLDPNGLIAMLGQRYPIYNIGFENLIVQLIEKGLRDRKLQHEVQVNILKDQEVDGRSATAIEVLNPEPIEGLDYYHAIIYIDVEWNVPTRFVSWDWPEEEGGEPLLLEDYVYEDMKLNVGLTDEDFNIENEQYEFK